MTINRGAMQAGAMPEVTPLAAFLAGLLGSAHCLAMCGGIATAAGAANVSSSRLGPLLYQLGRLGSYAIAGAIAGAVGAAAGFAFAVSHWNEWLRLATALLVIVIGLDISFGTSRRTTWLRAPERWGGRLWRRITPAARYLTPASATGRALTLGLLWGWLPCGLVYSVLIAAALAGSPARGAGVMVAFGLGTVPTMAGLGYLGGRLRPRPHGALARLLGAALVACGLWTAIVPLATLTGASPHAHHLTERP
jgi:uncharacterized protein